jgi:orotidine-5'-phosphate decarboxylase
MDPFGDRLADAVRSRGNALCVGLDPRWELLPDGIRRRHGDGSLAAAARAVEEFCLRILDVVGPLVPVVKPQSAFFEALGPRGMAALRRVFRRARRRGLLTIWDAKRGDIASTAEAYADAAFAGVSLGGAVRPVWDADAVTVNPYLGRDAVEPFLKRAHAAGRGVFVLVRTSNPGARLFQDLDCGGRPLYEHVARAVAAWSRQATTPSGFGSVGAVVGATYPAELAALRAMLPAAWLLVPGYGAQGGSAADTAAAFRDDGLGAVINSSRGITFCYPPGELRWEEAVLEATRSAVRDLARDTPAARLARE